MRFCRLHERLHVVAHVFVDSLLRSRGQGFLVTIQYLFIKQFRTGPAGRKRNYCSNSTLPQAKQVLCLVL